MVTRLMELTSFIGLLADEGNRPTREAANILLLCVTHVPQFGPIPDDPFREKDIAGHLSGYISLIQTSIVIKSVFLTEVRDGAVSIVSVMVEFDRVRVIT